MQAGRSVPPERAVATPIYMDYAATTPADPAVVAAMTRYLGPDGAFGNPASRFHAFGREAEAAVERARGQVADLLHADPREIVWTSGATESINLAIKGAAAAAARRGGGGQPQPRPRILTSEIEHKATLDSCRHLARHGFAIDRVSPDAGGVIAPDRIAAAIRGDTVLITLAHVNNELGTITDVASVAAIARERGVAVHVDAAQSAARLPLDVRTLAADFISLSGHKMYGPKGIGALYVRRNPPARLDPQMHGGGHERGRRSGTLATHQIVGMGEAARLLGARRAAEQTAAARLMDRFLAGLEAIPQVRVHGDRTRCVPAIVNLGFAAVESESLLVALPDIAVSTGSACLSARMEPSYVLRALGLDDDEAHGAVRFSLGRFTTPAEIDYAARRVREAVAELRALSSTWSAADGRPADDPAAGRPRAPERRSLPLSPGRHADDPGTGRPRRQAVQARIEPSRGARRVVHQAAAHGQASAARSVSASAAAHQTGVRDRLDRGTTARREPARPEGRAHP